MKPLWGSGRSPALSGVNQRASFPALHFWEPRMIFGGGNEKHSPLAHPVPDGGPRKT